MVRSAPCPDNHFAGNIGPLTILILSSFLYVCLFAGCDGKQPSSSPDRAFSGTDAFEQHKNDVQIEDEGVVSRILSDDTSGRTHQRFIVRLSSGQTVLLEHNTDLAPRIEDLNVGDAISFAGEYVWNEQGGVVHWTHHDPAGRHTAGWLKYKGRTYQ